MTLEEMLQHEMAQGLTVANKMAGLKKKVVAVESTENPDAFSYLEPNSIVITTAMVYKNDADGLCEFITGLNKRPCAAIAIKLGRYLERLEEKVVQTADDLGFPLLIIPENETLGRVYHSLLAILWNVKSREMLEAQQIKRQLYRLFLNGATLRRMLNSVSSVMRRHVLIVDLLGETLYENGIATEEEIKRALSVMKQIETKNVLWPVVRTIEDSQLIIYPVEFIRENAYFFVVFDKQPDSSTFLMEEIIFMLGTMMYKNLFLIYNEIWKEYNFLKRLVDINETRWSADQIMAEGKDYGMKLSLSYQMVVGRFLDLENFKFNNIEFTPREEKYISSYQSIKKILVGEGYRNKVIMLADIDNWQYILFIQGPCENLEEGLVNIARRIEHIMNEKIVFFAGRQCYNLAEAASSYWEINDSIMRFKGKENVNGVVSYEPKGIGELLKEIPFNQSRNVCEKILKDLAFPENDFTRELRRTLEVYLECGCSISETSKRLFLHRNTVRYRIKKCEELLETDLTSTGASFELQLCLELSK